MADACLRVARTTWDITGEEDVSRSWPRATPKQRPAGVVLLPGVGFDVVPSDVWRRT